MLKRLKSGKNGHSNSNSTDHTDQPAINKGSTKKSKTGSAGKSGVNSKSKKAAHGNSKSLKLTPNATTPQNNQAVEDKLRDALERIKQMEDAMRLIADEAKITKMDTKQMDITEVTTKLLQFVRGRAIANRQPQDIEAADSMLIEEVFEELDEHERKYQEKERAYSMTAPVNEEDDEFEDDVPPKRYVHRVTV